MKNIKTGLLSILVMTVMSCSFNQSASTDPITGAFSRGDGLTCDAVSIERNGIKENTNVFIKGEEVNFIFNGINGLTADNGKTFPGLSLTLMHKGTDTVSHLPDLFRDLSQGTDFNPLQLQAHFISVFENGETDQLKVHIKIWDKKGDGVFIYEMPFSIVPNEFFIVENNGLNFSDAYLWDDTNKLAVTTNEVSAQNTYALVFEGIQDLSEVDSKVFPKLSVELLDHSGSRLLFSGDILSEYEESGIDPAQFRDSQVTAVINFPSGELNNPHTLKSVLVDSNSERNITISSEFNIIP